MSEEIKALKSWLAVRGNSPASLASILGYSSSVVIDQWVRRNKIPEYQVQRVMEIVKNVQKKAGSRREK